MNRFLEDVWALDFDTSAAASFGTLRAVLERSGTQIGPNDMLIAAQTLSSNLVLVTDNESEFKRVAGLSVENWRH